MERKIGEIFTDGDVTLKVVSGTMCANCYYEKIMNCPNVTLENICVSDHRPTYRDDVVFIKHNPNDNT